MSNIPTATPVVSLSFQNAVAYLKIDRAAALNALNRQVLTELKQELNLLRTLSHVHFVVLCSAGEKAFVAGADIKEMSGLSPVEARIFSKLGSDVFLALESLPQVVIARVQGFALGGGLELAMAADFIVASSAAKFGLPEVSLGLIPGFGGTQRLAERIGRSRALEWMTTADKFSAEDAFTLGLVNKIAAPEELDSAVGSFLQRLQRNGPEAIKAAKQVVRISRGSAQSAYELEASAFGLLFGAQESREGMAAFVEKRPARFGSEAKA